MVSKSSTAVGSPHDRKFARRIATFSVLAAGLALTLFTALSWRSTVLEDQRQAFSSSAGDVAKNLDTLLQRDRDLVASTQAYYETDPSASASEFHKWMRQLDATDRYAGLDRAGLLERVSAARLPDFKRRALAESKDASSRFEIQPPGKRSSYCLTSAMASSADSFVFTPGTYFDFCQPGIYGQARAGLLRSIDSGVAGMMPSFGEMVAIYSPMFVGGRTPDTAAARRKTLTGWAIGFFHTDQILKAAVGERRAGIELFQKSADDKQTLLMKGGNLAAEPQLSDRIAIPGKDGLSVRVFGSPEVHGLSADAQAAVIVAAGFALFGILYTLIATLSRSRARALATVEKRTRELRHSEARLASIAKSSPTGIIQVEHDGTLRFANERFHELLGLDLERPRYDDWIERFDSSDREALRIALRDADDHDSELELRVAGDEPRWLRVSVAPITLADEELKDDGVVASLEDVTLARNARERLRFEARHDLLTGLANRTRFLENLQDALDTLTCEGDEFSVLYLDLDRFKPVNDVFGHAAGDELLQLVSDRLQSVLRGHDVLARHGGDEFTILLREYTDRAAVEAVVERLLDAIGKPFSVSKGETVTVGVSIGVVHVKDVNRTPADILRDADIAMYRAKQGRRGFEVFDDTDRQWHVAQLETERELRAAIDNHELELYYQPIINLDTGEVTGAEALIRWSHPTRGLLGPFEFLPLADTTGLIVPIGEWVIETAARFLSEREKDMNVGINLSAKQLLAENLVDRLCEITGRYGVDRAKFVIEVTESDQLVEEALVVADEIRARGFTIGIDDFGTGYNSLLYLKNHTLDFVKIDRSFVEDLGTRTAADALFNKIVELAHAFDLRVVAEGVETEVQAEIVCAGGSNFGQGFLWAKPMPAGAFDAFRNSFKADLPARPAVRQLRAV